MLSRANRLLKDRDIGRVQRFGRQSSSRYMSVRALETRHPNVRATFIVSKRIDRRSAARNRIKRRLRAAFRLSQSRLVGRSDIVVSARPDLKAADFKTISDQLALLLSKLGLDR